MAAAYDIALVRDNIRKILEFRNKSSFEVSVAIGKSRTYIDDFLRDRKQTLAVTAMQPMADYLNVSSTYLYGFEAVPKDLTKIYTNDFVKEHERKQERQLKKVFVSSDGTDIDISIDKEVITDQIPELVVKQNGYIRPDIIEGNVRVYSKSDIIDLWEIPLGFVQKVLDITSIFIDVIKVVDDAMYNPDGSGINRDDRVFVNTNDTNFNQSGIFALFDLGSVTIRRLNVVRNVEPPQFECLADNPKFPSFTATADDGVKIIGRVVLHLRRI